MTPKQRVKKRYPTAKSYWIGGWGCYIISTGLRQLAEGFNPTEAWRNAVAKLKS